jgi:hypothetical protein
LESDGPSEYLAATGFVERSYTMHLRSIRLSPRQVVSSIAVLLPLCLMAALSCGEWRVGSGSETVERAKCVPKLAALDAAVTTDAAPIADAGADSATPTDASADASTPRAQVERAILVSVDGLGGRYVDEQFAKGKLPGLAALEQAGSSTLNARSDYDNNYTLPNHTTILTGRPVNRDTDLPADAHHGWTINSVVDASYTLHNAGNPALKYVASVFDVAHDHGKKTCLYAGKLKFSIFSNSYNALNGAVDTVGDDNGRNKIDRVVLLENSTELLISTAEGDLAGGVCDLAFIHITDLDTIGHGMGWGSESWLTGLDQVDGWIKRLLRFTNPDDAGTPFGLVVTADHGGGDSGHGDPTDLWCYQVPFFAVGPGFTPNTDLYALAGSARCEPGLVRLRYSAIPQPIRNADAPNVILTMLGLPPVPGSLMRNLLAQK